MSKITLIPCVDPQNPVESARKYNHTGADVIAYYEEKASIDTVKAIKEVIDVPLYVGGGIRDLEDVKKVLYAGADKVCLGASVLEDKDIVKKASDRFGKGQVMVSMDLEKLEDPAAFAKEMQRLGAGELLLLAADGYDKKMEAVNAVKSQTDLPIVISVPSVEDVTAAAGEICAESVAIHDAGDFSVLDLKKECKNKGLDVCLMESPIPFEEFKLNSDGLLPVVTQDYKTNEVLMVAYMTKEAFEQTVETGIMTYYSRSRQELWIKGETSGHYQYVKSLAIDCDKDTLLAKVRQVGNACHTGHYSCFFTDLVKKEYREDDPMHVFEDVYGVIMDRKEHPKEGSYTNYLFEKGIDKILKKVGEECTEIVIAAKNPDPEEMKYEISDFLYHLMVLMAQRGMTWDEITRELMERK
nr:bifunctional phosphoribosyl-AMP cyclohydrolase/phosphoribosyl-ATP diphosphatase HisIE [uncultured Anaerostipes sp.]